MQNQKDWRVTFGGVKAGKDMSIEIKNKTPEDMLTVATTAFKQEFQQANTVLIEAVGEEATS